MRKLSANLILPVSSAPVENGLLVLDDDGTVIELQNTVDNEGENVEKYDGILVPGFINSHVHLELSYLRGRIPQKTSLDQFVRSIEEQRRNFAVGDMLNAANEAELEMIREGIVGAGDICNGNLTFDLKETSTIRYYSFVELFAFMPERAEAVFNKGQMLASELQKRNLAWSITPHAPYSVSPALFDLINDQAPKGTKNLLSIHMAENEDEAELFRSGTGKVIERMQSFGVDVSEWITPGQRPLKWTISSLSHAEKILLVHNTMYNEEDLYMFFRHYADLHDRLVLCFCPSANLYIENKVPPFERFYGMGYDICIGTDSLASNTKLSILEELKVIHHHAPSIPLDRLIRWATISGARLFGWEKDLGSFEKGKRPGVNLIEGANLEKKHLGAGSSLRKIA
jgi:aminodeoxyfutalosine deaminase